MAYPATDNLPPVHPGELLADELAAVGLSARRFAGHIGVPPNAVTAILNGDRRVTAEMALRLGKAFGTGERYWMNLQALYDTKIAREKMAERIAAIEPLVTASE
jgi:addiction module HigA family antidote